jgi:PAS domain-containing protein
MALPTILAIASVLGLLTLVGACRRHRTPGAWWLAVFAAALTWWDVWSVLELATDDFAQMVLASKIEYVGIAVLPVAWLQLGARLRGDGRRLPSRVWYLLAPVAILVPLLAATNDLHHLVWANIYQLPIGSSPKAVYEHGPAWFAIVGWTYVLLTWGTVLLVRAGLSWRRQDRAKAWLLIGAVLVPWIANVAYAANLLPVPGLEPTPVALTVTAALLLVGLDRLRLLDLTPIAAEVLLANLSDALLVIDDAGCVVHANPAARTLGLLRWKESSGCLPPRCVLAGSLLHRAWSNVIGGPRSRCKALAERRLLWRYVASISKQSMDRLGTC